MIQKVLRLAIPSIVSNITIPLLGLVDVAITGHMGDAAYMAAIAVGSMVFNIIYWLFSFLRFGTGGMTAQAFGESSSSEGDKPECCRILVRSLCVSLVIALFLLAVKEPLFRLGMWTIEPDSDILPIIHSYYSICIWGTVPSLALYAMTGWFVGMQNTVYPMLVSISQNIINICLSAFFVFCCDMKIEGVALGTLIAQWGGALIAVGVILLRFKPVWSNFKLAEEILPILKSMTSKMGNYGKVNTTLFIRTLFLVAVNLFFIMAGAKGGTVILAVNSVLMQMFILVSYVMDGFAFAAEALCGRYYGASDESNFRLALRSVWLCSIVLTVAYSLVYYVGGEGFLNLLTDDASIRSAAVEYLPWAIAIPVCGMSAFVLDGVFVGITNVRGMLYGTFAGAAVFFVLYYTLSGDLHNHALWLAFNCYLLMRGVIQHIIFAYRK